MGKGDVLQVMVSQDNLDHRGRRRCVKGIFVLVFMADMQRR